MLVTLCIERKVSERDTCERIQDAAGHDPMASEYCIESSGVLIDVMRLFTGHSLNEEHVPAACHCMWLGFSFKNFRQLLCHCPGARANPLGFPYCKIFA